MYNFIMSHYTSRTQFTENESFFEYCITNYDHSDTDHVDINRNNDDDINRNHDEGVISSGIPLLLTSKWELEKCT